MSNQLKLDGVMCQVGNDEFEPAYYTNFTLYTTEYIEDMECELPNGLKVAIYVEDGDYTSIDIISNDLFYIVLHTGCTECNRDITVQFPFIAQNFQDDRLVVDKATFPCEHCRKPQYKGFKFKVLEVK